LYNFERQGVLAVLPDEVAEEDYDEIVISADEAAEEADELGQWGVTMIDSMSISMRWSVWGSWNLPCCIFDII